MKQFILSIFTLLVFSYNAHSQVVITELLYNAPGSDTIEFVELYNNSAAGVNLTGWNFTRGITYTFSGIFMSPGQYIIVARDASAFQNAFGQTALEWELGGLSNGGESLVLVNAQGMIMDTINYETTAPWPTGPVSPDGGGASIVLCDPNLDNNDPANWTAGDLPTGILVNGLELYTHPGTTCPGIDLLPPVPTSAYAISQNQVIVEFNEAVNTTGENGANYGNLGSLTAVRDATNQIVTLTLSTPLQDGVLTTMTVSDIQDLLNNQMSVTNEFNVIWHSTGEVRDIVITEIMYNAPGNDSLDFIELYNNSGIARNLWGCYFDQGIDFEFPDIIMQPGDYLVLAEDSANFELTYGITPFQWGGQLDNNSEKIIFNYVDGDTIDFVDYNDNNGWPEEADGLGYSLVLCDPNDDNMDTLSWSIATTFTNITIGDTLDMYANPGMADPGCPVAIREVEELSGVSIYPNPNSGLFVIENENTSPLHYTITSLLGQNLQAGRLDQPMEQIELKNVPKGMYLLTLEALDSGRKTTERVLVTGE